MKEKYFIYFILLVVVVLNLPLPVSMHIKSTSRDNFAPFQNVMSYLISKTRLVFSLASATENLIYSERRSRDEIATLKIRIRRLDALKKENKKLRKQLGFKAMSKYSLISCKVIVRLDSSGWWQTVRINKGATDGISSNMAVMTVDGILGKTFDVSRNTSDVLLIIDPTSKVACKVLRSGGLGILKGMGVFVNGKEKLEMFFPIQPCKMDYIDKNLSILEGDIIVTSGLGGVYPEGLPIGKVEKVKISKSGLYQRADIIPVADMNTLEYVFVVSAISVK